MQLIVRILKGVCKTIIHATARLCPEHTQDQGRLKIGGLTRALPPLPPSVIAHCPISSYHHYHTYRRGLLFIGIVDGPGVVLGVYLDSHGVEARGITFFR